MSLSSSLKWLIDSYWNLSANDNKVFIRLASNLLYNREFFNLEERQEALIYINEKYNLTIPKG